MKGLLYKDLIITIKVLFITLIAIVCFSASQLIPGGSVMYMFAWAMAGMVPMHLMSQEELDHWTAYSAALPCSRRTVVTEKYVVFLIMAALTLVLNAAFCAIRGIMDSGAVDLAEIAAQSGMGFSLAVMIPALGLPVFFLLGPEKGRLWYTVCVMVTFIALSMLGSFLTFSGLELPAVLPIVTPLAMAALLVLSWAVSVAMYRRRDL